VRTTIEIPDELLRQAKARAALRGMKLKELVAEALEAALYYPSDRASPSRVSDGTEEETNVVVLADNCVFPRIRGDCGAAMQDATGDKLNAILEEEEVERALYSRRR